jgi:hypothetical protein
MPSRSFSSEKSYSPRLSETAERVLSGRIHQIRMQGDCPAGKPRGRDAGGVQDSEAAHLNSLKRALESQISMSHLVPLLEFNPSVKRILSAVGTPFPRSLELGKEPASNGRRYASSRLTASVTCSGSKGFKR